MHKYTVEEIEMVVEFAVDLIDQLETAIEKYENGGDLKLNIVSDDGMQDVLAEIVSKGVDVVEKYINNPTLIEKKYEDEDYTENFLNCLPYKDDYEKMNLDYYQKVSEEIKEMAARDKISIDDFDKLVQILSEFSKGEFKKEYDYGELYEFGYKIDIGACIAITWKAGSDFLVHK
jgi:hypothetical protein